MNIKDKTILITGGAVRIGRAITLEMVKSGAEVYCHYNNSEDEAISLQKEIEKSGGKLSLIKSDFSQTKHTLEIILNEFGNNKRVDVLINNAAIFYKTPLKDVNENDWDRFSTINLKTPFFLAQEIGLKMKQQGFGKIINIGDTRDLNHWYHQC